MSRYRLNDIIEKYGSDTVYEGTNVDSATQQIILDWLFDYKISTKNKNADNWLRYYRRRLNVLYPRYLDLVRVLGVRENFDPYVTDYFEDVASHLSFSAMKENGQRSPNLTTTTSAASTNNNESLSTPNLKETMTYGSSTTDLTLRSDDLTDNSTRTKTEVTDSKRVPKLTNEAITSGDHTVTEAPAVTETVSTKDKTYSNVFGVAYPEANMTSVPVEANSAPDLQYVSNQTYSPNYEETEQTTIPKGENKTTTKYNDEKVTTKDTGEETSSNSTSDASFDSTSHTGNQTNSGAHTKGGSDVRSNSGSEKTNVKDNKSDITITDSTGAEYTNKNSHNSDTSNNEVVHKGRNESVADIIPRAVRAITGTQPVLWLIDSLKVCFDCYDLSI